MTQRLRNKTALVTAAGQGIGRETVLAFAEEGARVIATDIDDAKLSSLTGPSIKTHILDVRDRDAINRLASEVPELDILFNCAGYVANGSILDCAPEDWDASMAINVTSMYDTIRAFLPRMINAGKGTIINMSSVASSITGVPSRFAYGATKAAVIGLTKAVAADFVAKGIRCNAICPGTIETPSLDERINAHDDPVAARAAFVERQPMGRLGRAEEVAALALYLASDEAAYTTGAIHVVDGGWTM